MHATMHRQSSQYAPFFLMAAMSATIGAFYGRMALPSGLGGAAIGMVVGLVWALLIGIIAGQLMDRGTWRARLADTSVALAVIALGLMTGGGLMYGWMMAAAVNEPSATYEVLSVLMWPAVPFYITLNTIMETLIVGFMVFANWHADPRRKALILLSVVVYFVMRVWTYLMFAEARLDIARHALSPADVEWFKSTLAIDFRIVLNMISFICLVLAALAPSVAPRDNSAAPVVGRQAVAAQ
jgi:hypothetical protein